MGIRLAQSEKRPVGWELVGIEEVISLNLYATPIIVRAISPRRSFLLREKKPPRNLPGEVFA